MADLRGHSHFGPPGARFGLEAQRLEFLTGFTQFLLCVRNVKNKAWVKENVQYLFFDSGFNG